MKNENYPKIERNTVETVSVEYLDYIADKPQLLTVTNWRNGEGVDVTLTNNSSISFGLSHSEAMALRVGLDTIQMMKGDTKRA